jgi:hypothetical protein
MKEKWDQCFGLTNENADAISPTNEDAAGFCLANERQGQAWLQPNIRWSGEQSLHIKIAVQEISPNSVFLLNNMKTQYFPISDFC